MKNLIKYFAIIIIISACDHQNDTTATEINTTIQVESPKANTGAKLSRGQLIKLDVEYGMKVCIPGTTNCSCQDNDLNLFCTWKIKFIDVPPFDIEEPPMVPGFCHIIPCGWNYDDPWEFYENIDPLKLASIKDHFKLEIEQPSAQGFLFLVNESLLGVQFYKVNQMMGEPNPQPNIYYLENEIIFAESFAKEMGLEGQIIEPGKYPILYNKENETYNVIFKVQ